MKALVQAFLIGGGILGLIPSIVVAIHEWPLQGAFALLGLLVCCLAIASGSVWRRHTKGSEPRRSPGQLTEDPGTGV